MKNKKLVYIDDIPTPYRLDVHKAIAKKWEGEYKVLYLASEEPGRSWDLDFTNLDFEVIPGIQISLPFKSNPFAFKWNRLIYRYLNCIKPDYVVLSGYIHPSIIYAFYWCRKNRIPYGVACETSCLSTKCDGVSWQIKKRIFGSVVKNMSFGLPQGKDSAEYLNLLGNGSFPMFPFPNTPNPNRFIDLSKNLNKSNKISHVLSLYGIPKNKRVILFVGRLIEAKRPDDLIRAFEKVYLEYNNSLVLFIGDGPLMGQLVKKSKSMPIIFTGWIKDQDHIALLMAYSTVFVLPSEHEPWGAVVNEALASGTPVLASNKVVSGRELIRDGMNGFVFDVGDTNKLSNYLCKLLSSKDSILLDMSKNAQSTALEFDHNYAADNLIKAALESEKCIY